MMFDCFENLDKITIKNLTTYLEKKGWKLNNEFPNKRLFLFEKTFDDDIFSITIPIKETFKDYILRLNDTLNLLKELEEREIYIILRDIININNNKQDKLSLRVISEVCENGTLPLEYGSNIVDGLKRLILSAINVEKTPIPYFTNNKGSHESLSKFKLGQTNFGSYIFNIEVENDDCSELKFDEDGGIENVVESRKVIKRIQNGINDVITATKEGNVERLYRDGYKKGLNANMCDALLNFKYENYEVKIESTVKWSDQLPKPDDILEKVTLKDNDFYTIKLLSDKYKQTDIKWVNLIGKIIRLNNTHKSQRYVIMECMFEEKLRHIKVFLNKEDYERACEFHKNDKNVSIEGEIAKEGRKWILYNYKNLLNYRA